MNNCASPLALWFPACCFEKCQYLLYLKISAFKHFQVANAAYNQMIGEKERYNLLNLDERWKRRNRQTETSTSHYLLVKSLSFKFMWTIKSIRLQSNQSTWPEYRDKFLELVPFYWKLVRLIIKSLHFLTFSNPWSYVLEQK